MPPVPSWFRKAQRSEDIQIFRNGSTADLRNAGWQKNAEAFSALPLLQVVSLSWLSSEKNGSLRSSSTTATKIARLSNSSCVTVVQGGCEYSQRHPLGAQYISRGAAHNILIWRVGCGPRPRPRPKATGVAEENGEPPGFHLSLRGWLRVILPWERADLIWLQPQTPSAQTTIQPVPLPSDT